MSLARGWPRFLVVPCRVSRQLENFSRQVLQDRRHVDSSSGAHAVSISSLSQMPLYSTNREGKTCPGTLRYIFCPSSIFFILKNYRFLPNQETTRLKKIHLMWANSLFPFPDILNVIFSAQLELVGCRKRTVMWDAFSSQRIW